MPAGRADRPVMDPQKQLDDYCRRYGVGKSFGQRLLPLLERAQKARESVRARIIELVEASFEKEASLQAMKKRGSGRGAPAKRKPGDDAVLQTVAAMLHNWTPPPWSLEWGDRDRDPNDDGPGTAGEGDSGPESD